MGARSRGRAAGDLHELIGGHLLSLQIALASAQGPAGPDLHAVHEDLQRELASRIAEAPLLRIGGLLALCDVVTPATADAALVVASPDGSERTGRQVIADLSSWGLLHPVPGEHGLWAYPQLIREALAGALLQTSPEMVARGHQVIGRSLHAERSDMGRVLRHARHGRDWSLLARLWCGLGVTLLVEHPTDSVIAFGELPDRALAGEPVLATPEAMVTSVQPGSRLGLHAALRRRRGVPSDRRRPEQTQIVDDAAVTLILRRSSGDVAGALRAATETADVSAMLPDDARGVIAWFQLQWAITELVAGDLSAAGRRLNEVHEAADRPEAAFISSSAAAHLALVHALSGATAEAVSWLDRQSDPGVGGLQPLVSTPASLTRALLAIDRLDGAAAQAALDQVPDHTRDELWMCVAYVMTQHALIFGSAIAMRAHLDHLADRHAVHLQAGGAASRMLQQCRADVLMALGEGNRAEALVGADAPKCWMWAPAARLRLLRGDHAAALELASSSAWHPSSTVRDQVDLLMIRAAATRAMGRDAEHAEVAAQAHALADHAGIRSACLLVPEGACGRSHADLETGRRAFPDRVDLVMLTPREKQVLALMRQHDSLAGIARALTVSVNTVKKQSVAIHAKLGVSSRHAALLRAEALGVLEPRVVRGPDADQPRTNS